MSVYDELGCRMKTFYEQTAKTKLLRRTPVAIRIDGKAFHTFTRGFEKPYDPVLIRAMQETMKYLCENVQGCVLGYTQSDEITLILVDYKKLNSAAWFDYEVQKMCSISSSMATMQFNRVFRELAAGQERYGTALEKGAMFDARCFNIPKEEVTNLIYWRQLDASRNSVQMAGQACFSHRELQRKSCNEIQDMLMQQKGINWNDFPIEQKRGSCCIKKGIPDEDTGRQAEDYVRKHWVIDREIPLFKGEGRDYIEALIHVGE